jgi:hypothetical protein
VIGSQVPASVAEIEHRDLAAGKNHQAIDSTTKKTPPAKNGLRVRLGFEALSRTRASPFSSP